MKKSIVEQIVLAVFAAMNYRLADVKPSRSAIENLAASASVKKADASLLACRSAETPTYTGDFYFLYTAGEVIALPYYTEGHQMLGFKTVPKNEVPTIGAAASGAEIAIVKMAVRWNQSPFSTDRVWNFTVFKCGEDFPGLVDDYEKMNVAQMDAAFDKA